MTERRGLSADERRRKLQEEITLWVGNRRLDQAMTREQVAHLEGGHRFFTLAKSLIPGLIAICRADKRSPATEAAVFALITMLSDNYDARCRLTIKRIAELLGRKEDNIRQTIKDLEKLGLVGIERTTGGLPNTYWPLVPTAIADTQPAMVWFVEALSTKPPVEEDSTSLKVIPSQTHTQTGPSFRGHFAPTAPAATAGVSSGANGAQHQRPGKATMPEGWKPRKKEIPRSQMSFAEMNDHYRRGGGRTGRRFED